MTPETILILSILAAGFYMAWNIGANDVANAMGTSVGSGALSLRRAVIIAAVLEFSGAFFFGSHVSKTIQSGLIDVTSFASNPLILVYGMLSVLISAGVWLQIASYFGWPVSTTHTIVGAVVGFGIICAGIDSVYWGSVSFIVTSWALSPLFGGIVSFLIFSLLRRTIFYTPTPLETAKKITPFLVLLVLTILSLILVFDGLKNLNLELTFWQGVLCSMVPGLIGAFISWLLIKDMSLRVSTGHQKVESSTTTLGQIEEAQHHLLLASAGLSQEIQGRLSEMIEEMDHFKPVIKSEIETSTTASEYAMVEKIFSYLQIMSACLMAFAHGTNDVANAIGPLAAALATLQAGTIVPNAPIPAWLLALGGFGIVVGLATWGWRVIETIGKKITELTPTRGFAAEFGAATTIVIASQLGMPVSSTHTLVGSVLGVGLARGIEALNLGMTRDIFISWLVTVPAGAGAAVFFFYILKAIFL